MMDVRVEIYRNRAGETIPYAEYRMKVEHFPLEGDTILIPLSPVSANKFTARVVRREILYRQDNGLLVPDTVYLKVE